jgi:membrane-bound lytic murein transglycosylase B
VLSLESMSRVFRIIGILCASLVLLASLFGSAGVLSAAELSPAERAALEFELRNIESQIAAQRKILDVARQQSSSLQRDVAILNARIKEAQLSLQARNLSIQRLSREIDGKQQTIGVLSSKMERERESLGQLIRKTAIIDDYSIAEFALSGRNLSDFFADLDAFQSVKEQLQESSRELGEARNDTQAAKDSLEDKRSEELQLRRIQELQKKAVQDQEAEKKRILSVSKGQEAEYQRVIQSQEQSAATIRARLFNLEGAGPIPFQKAYEYATEASQKTGVRAAVILGIIATESNLGKNLGVGNWRADMAQRDWADFQSITSRLGLDPDAMPISARPCSAAERKRVGPGVACGYGWGGAMGPAQFIPSTWLLYEKRISAITGTNPPNPWNPRDAFMASALLMKDNGANRGTRTAERLAALRYLAGWKNAEKAAYAFYGDQVMSLADGFQAQIDILNAAR